MYPSTSRVLHLPLARPECPRRQLSVQNGERARVEHRSGRPAPPLRVPSEGENIGPGASSIVRGVPGEIPRLCVMGSSSALERGASPHLYPWGERCRVGFVADGVDVVASVAARRPGLRHPFAPLAVWNVL